MSVKASSWVWHESPRESIETADGSVTIEGTELIVLLALADIADDNGNCVYGDSEDRKQVSLAKKARVSVSTFRRTTKQLEAAGILTVRKVGLVNLYTINLDWASISRDLELSTTGQDDRLANEALPVMGDRYYRSAVTGHKDVIHKDLNPSSINATTERELSGDDDRGSHPSPARIPHPQRAIEWQRVLEGVSPIFSSFAPDDLHAIGAEIIARASSRVLDPTRFVAQALRNDPFEWQQRAFELDVARVEAGGNPF